MDLVSGDSERGWQVENPFMAAQTFLVKNELPASYLDQVVDFIHKNTNGETLGQDTSNTYVDPYTGSSRYTGSTAQNTNQGGSDPFTGTSFRVFIFSPVFPVCDPIWSWADE
jgi:hypothetical protein